MSKSTSKNKPRRRQLPEHCSSPDAVGYGNPPKEHQFKKGQSGNPKGRPRGSLSLEALINKELSKRITITENGQRRRVTVIEAMAKRLVNNCLKGELPSLKLMLQNSLLSANCSGSDDSENSFQYFVDILNKVSSKNASNDKSD